MKKFLIRLYAGHYMPKCILPVIRWLNNSRSLKQFVINDCILLYVDTINKLQDGVTVLDVQSILLNPVNIATYLTHACETKGFILLLF